MLTGCEIREKFIEFFEEKAHKHYDSASLIPDDKTLLLTVAGMVPFKPFFLGQKEAPHKRVTTYQKCIRTNDLENVGRTARHQTFFEMLGNFSFGDYFKEESIVWSYEFITEVLKLPKEKIWISVFETDDEAEKIWVEKCNFPIERIVRMDESENWWSAGPTGSCGPSSEIYVDLGPKFGGEETSRLGDPDLDDRFIEIWNLVFTEWNKLEDGSLEPLPKKNIDTGAGLERLAAVLQNKKNNFETDLIFPIIEDLEKICQTKYGTSKKNDFSLKVIADHIRAITFLIGDGVIPSNEGRGYVLRRIIRRAIRHGKLLGREELFLKDLVGTVIKIMSAAYPELTSQKDHIVKLVRLEEEKFSHTLEQGLQILEEELEKLKANNLKTLSGEIAFKLYDTFGFPLELTEEICEEHSFEVDINGFKNKMNEQKQRARSSRSVIKEKGQDIFIETFFDKHGKTEFVGYDTFETEATILHVKDLHEGKFLIIFDKTPCYAESGGQASDTGKLVGDGILGAIQNVQKQKDIFMHTVNIVEGAGKLRVGEKVSVGIDKYRRDEIKRNHTATHLLHKALKKVLGDHVKQAGSQVSQDRLRFDFTHYEAITRDDLKLIERTVNEEIFKNTILDVKELSIEEATKQGAVMLFDDKYGDMVRVVDVPGFSMELCGGTHVERTGEIGLFNILHENGIAAGVRRIEATTGFSSYRVINTMKDGIFNIAKILKTDFSHDHILAKAEKLMQELKETHKEVEELKSQLAKYQLDNIFNNVEEINGVKVLKSTMKDSDSNTLREIVDRAKDKLGSCVILLGSDNGNAAFVVGVTKDLTGKVKAGDLVREIAIKAGGKGGGRPDFAQAGGPEGNKVKEAIDYGFKVLQGQL